MRCLLYATLLGCVGFSCAQTVVPSPDVEATGSTADVSLSLSGTTWNPGHPPEFSVVAGGATILRQSVLSAKSAMLTISFGAAPKLVEINDPSTNTDFYIETYAPLRVSQPFVVTGSTGNVLTLTGIGTSWNEHTTFMLTGCVGPSILAQSVTSSTTATITVNAGANECTAGLLDPTTKHMATLQVHTPRTWYVRSDGGTRYSANRVRLGLSVQCSGLYDASYPGSGTNQNCAFNDYRFLFDDQATYGQLNWVISGGDTVVVDNTAHWRIGLSQGMKPYDPWCQGIGPYACVNPTIPAGIASQHTRILGRNYASCNAGSQPDKTKMTQIFGGYGSYTPMNLTSTQYVDVQCLEITSHANCIVHGLPNPNPCRTDFPLSDYDDDGVITSNETANVLLQDVWVHGHTDRGVIGALGGVVTCERCDIGYNTMAGWDFDDGSNSYCYDNHCYGTPSRNGTWQLYHSSIEWNGCAQEYPMIHPYPAAYCYAQQTEGYGDGVGSPPGGCFNVDVEGSTFAYNTQDGLDVGHADAGPSGTGYADQGRCTMLVKQTMFLGNMGAGPKWGPNMSPVTIVDNLMLLNCWRMSQPIPGASYSFNWPFLSQGDTGDFCRAGDAISWGMHDTNTVVFSHNSVIAYSPTTYDVACWEGNNRCPGATVTFEDNITMGLDDPQTYIEGGKPGGPGDFCWLDQSTNDCTAQPRVIGNLVRDHNLWWGMRNIKGPTGFAGEVVANPLFVAEPTFLPPFPVEAVLDNFIMTLTSSSPAIRAGIGVSGTPVDYLGNPYASPPAIGALELGSWARATLPGQTMGGIFFYAHGAN